MQKSLELISSDFSFANPWSSSEGQCPALPFIGEENPVRVLPVEEYGSDLLPNSVEQFAHSYGDGATVHKPIVFREAAKHWPAASWTPKRLAEQYGDLSIPVYLNWNEQKKFKEDALIVGMLVREHIKDIFLNPENSGYTLIHNDGIVQEYLKEHPELRFAYRFPVYKWDDDDYIVFIGSGGSQTKLHNHEPVFLAQLYGSKLVTMIAPEYSDDVYCEYEGRIGISLVNPITPDLVRYPKFENVILRQVILNPGDILYIPNRWFHHVQALGTPTISVTKFMKSPSVSDILEYLQTPMPY